MPVASPKRQTKTMQEILDAFAEHGLDPGPLVLDGKPKRFAVEKSDRKKSGWYIGHQNHTRVGGELFYVVMFGNYRSGMETQRFVSNGVKLSADDKRSIKEQIAKANKLAEQERERDWEEVAKEVSEFWETLSVSGESEYLTEKGITGIELGIRFDRFRGEIYVPIRDGKGKLWSLQSIARDGRKGFYPGGRVSGGYHTIGSLDGNDPVLVAEGLSTSATLRAATGYPVICCFSSVNMEKVARTLGEIHQGRKWIVCGDDDRRCEHNAGRAAAERSATILSGTAVFPRFPDGNDGTDFNDLGIEETRRQLVGAEEQEGDHVIPLGFRDREYFFTSSQNRQVVGVNGFSERDFLDLMTIDYWETVFPGSGASRISWADARSTMMDKCRKKGIFQPERVRGSGVWMDDGRIVVNMGNHLVVDGKRVELGRLKSQYFYTLGKSLERLHSEPLSSSECKLFVDTCNKFKWTKEDSGILLAGALVLSRVCGALPVRPHVWLTGGAHTGKSTLQQQLVSKILAKSKLYFVGNTTEAGVRQSLKADAVPVLFDEFEITGRNADENIASLIDLMRAAWSESDAVIAKGGASGNASHYQARFSAIVSSIRTKLINDADRGRFAVLELAPHSSDAKHWTELSSMLCDITPEYSERLFARTIRLLPVVLANFRLIKRSLSTRVNSRFGDQYGMLLAGFSVLLHDETLSTDEADWLADQVKLTEEKETAKIADHDDALNHLLTTKYQYDGRSSRREASVGKLIATVWKERENDSAEKEALLQLGIQVRLETVSVITGQHAEQEAKVWRGTKWVSSWGSSLLRLPGAERKQMKFYGINRHVIRIPASVFGLGSD